MSSIPGYTLEEFLAWNWNLRVIGLNETNVSVGIAEVLGNVSPRPSISQDDFDAVVALYEPYRDTIESLLLDFNEEEQSWRSYAEVVDLDVPESVHEAAKAMLSHDSEKETEPSAMAHTHAIVDEYQVALNKMYQHYHQVLYQHNGRYVEEVQDEIHGGYSGNTLRDSEHITWMLNRLLSDPTRNKVAQGRWLGYIQGWFIEKGLMTLIGTRHLTREHLREFE